MAEERNHTLGPNRCQTQEIVRNWWVVNAEPESTPEDYVNPSYWANYSRDFKPLELIEVRKDDGAYWGLFIVLATDRTYTKVGLIIEKNLTTKDVAMTQAALAFTYAWKGPTKKHCVIRLSDQQIVHEGEQTKTDALRWLAENEASLT